MAPGATFHEMKDKGAGLFKQRKAADAVHVSGRRRKAPGEPFVFHTLERRKALGSLSYRRHVSLSSQAWTEALTCAGGEAGERARADEPGPGALWPRAVRGGAGRS